MSRQGVEIVRAGLEAFNARDVDAFAALAAADIVWLPALPGAVEGGTYVGRSGIDRYFAESAATWAQLTVRDEEIRDAGDRVVVLGRAVGRGLGSGAEVDMALAFTVELRDGLISRVTTYLEHAAALEAAGLER